MSHSTTGLSAETVVMVVANDASNDARVKKTALSVARLGFSVTILAVSQTGHRYETKMGPVRIVRLPLTHTLRSERQTLEAADEERRAELRRRRERRYRRFIRPFFGPRRDRGRRVLLAEFETVKREAEVGIALEKSKIHQLPEDVSGLRRIRTGVERRLRWRRIARQRARVARHRARLRNELTEAEVDEQRAPVSSQFAGGDWRDLLPEMHDFERAFAPELRLLSPDIVHAHDFTMIGIAARHAILARSAGHDVRVIYDAHEYTPGVALPDPRRERGYAQMEREYLKHVDAVTTVSPQIAKAMREDHALERAPEVILNVPLKSPPEGDRISTVREVIGLGDDVPLVVYSGGIAPKRRVGLLVQAMEFVEAAHLVLVAGDERRLEPLREMARAGGYGHRLHVAPFVAPDLVPAYLRSADVGVHPMSTDIKNHQLALPNKLFEYLHAGLPMVVADNAAMRDFILEWRLGEVFEGDQPEELAARLTDVLSDPSRYDAGRLSTEALARFTWEAQEPALARAYSMALERDVTVQPSDLLFTFDEVQRGLSYSRCRRPLHGADFRLAIGPKNMAGQGWEWARAVEEADESIAVEVYALEKEVFDFPSDVTIAEDRWGELEWQLGQARHILSSMTHVLMEAGLPLFGRLNGSHFDGDVPSLRAHGVTPAVVLHGSELRDPSRHRALERFSPFGLGADSWVAQIQARVDALRPRLDAFDGAKFVTTAGLLDFLPDAAWLPVVVDLELWRPGRPVLDHAGPPIVAFAPTNNRLKGSAVVVDVCRRLAQQGLLDFRPIEQVPFRDMPGVLRSADVVIDGLLLGDYGVTACQALAAGRIVVGNVGQRVRDRIRSGLPIVQADPSSLEQVLVDLVTDADALSERAGAGRSFVREFHDGHYSSRVLAEWMEVPTDE